ncbi:hypothetical protein RJ639_007793 [Escallonia herrerae]|uniref:E3 ubiquitin-protein ligase RMA n=1 Tax=Escallonia herrerae TaxID=1293975 RepID=A0AA89AVX5_9ASTE|nr:hypothetical protein RJ639_007793 [Escallonia herrerae]
MAFEQYFAKEWKSIPAAGLDSEKTTPCFDCNICLDFARDPVVTLCGHLYCWPCIYKWFHFQSATLASDEHPQCPVCKAEISYTTMVPLYGRGQMLSEAEPEGGKAPKLELVIPPRPPACGTQALVPAPTGQQRPYRNPYQNLESLPQPYGSFEQDSSAPLLNFGGSTPTGAANLAMGMFGEMVYARVFGNSESLYAYPNSYHLEGFSSPRLRRQEMQADKSLFRVTVFLCCCFFLCLALF